MSKEKAPKYTRKEMEKMQEARALSDANLLKEGAVYKYNEKTNELELTPTPDQLSSIESFGDYNESYVRGKREVDQLLNRHSSIAKLLAIVIKDLPEYVHGDWFDTIHFPEEGIENGNPVEIIEEVILKKPKYYGLGDDIVFYLKTIAEKAKAEKAEIDKKREKVGNK